MAGSRRRRPLPGYCRSWLCLSGGAIGPRLRILLVPRVSGGDRLHRLVARGHPGLAGPPPHPPPPPPRPGGPLVAGVLAPLGLLGSLGYVALATHRLDGGFWIEKHTCHMALDWGVSTMRVVKGTLLGAPSVPDVLVVLAIIVAAVLAMWSL